MQQGLSGVIVGSFTGIVVRPSLKRQLALSFLYKTHPPICNQSTAPFTAQSHYTHTHTICVNAAICIELNVALPNLYLDRSQIDINR